MDVVVTELVDSGLLGEHILGVLRHAEKNLLKPGGVMVPYKGSIKFVLSRHKTIIPLATSPHLFSVIFSSDPS